MRYRPWMVLALSLLAAAPGPNEAAKKDAARLQGAWVAVSIEIEGQKLDEDDIREVRLIIQGDQLTVQRGDQVVDQGTNQLDPTRKPRVMDNVAAIGPQKGQVRPGIYELAGDSLKICLAQPGSRRPTDFSARAGSNQSLFVLKRAGE